MIHGMSTRHNKTDKKIENSKKVRKKNKKKNNGDL